ncbi:TRAP transporter large permease [Propionivibrio dicarboxylicus]|uniref:TRAP transporter large permease protein n=1 Tax=Propionivibrio dicarboxylicus TaxID=83767 RepID=A0A1G8KMM9_9RHOO|nr:TRAP transporter large permease [Propionivibrio dicarboxylicus]SDI44695.1 TRAP transporter, DctM subunit [Propionivibrio dicarboxylicus]
MLTLSIFAVLLLMLLIDIPIAVAIGLTAVVFFVAQGQSSFLAMLPQRMYSGTTGFTLLAIPFFILAGNLMNCGGTTQRLFRFARALVGHVPGGVGQVSVVSSMIFSGMSGSAVADAAGLGQIQHRAMVDAGYKPTISAAIVAGASTIGPVIPPSIPFVLYGAITSVSVSRLFLAGAIPGAVMGLAMMLAIWLMAKPRNLPKDPRANLHEIWDSFTAAFLPLMAPVIIIGGITTGFFTPTEASVIASLYALALGFLYRDLTWKEIPAILFTSLKQTCGLMFIIATANFFGWFTIFERIPDALITQLAAFGTTATGFIWIVIAIVLVLGCFIDGNAIFLITLPIFMKLCPLYGVDMVNFGVVMTLLIMIGNLTPPVGMCLFAVESFAKVGIWSLAYECFPYLIAILAVTILCAFVPEIALWLPNYVMGAAG